MGAPRYKRLQIPLVARNIVQGRLALVFSGSQLSLLRTNSISAVSSYLPTILSNVWEPSRNFAHLKIPNDSRSVLCMTSEGLVHVVSENGWVGEYPLDLANGGELLLERESTLPKTA